MYKLVSLASTVLLSMLVVVSSVQAVPNAGVTARLYENPVSVHKAADGSQVFHIQSTGTSIRNKPDNPPQGHRWQHCTGLWTAKADNSGSGSGHCYFADSDGDQSMIAWEGTNAGGTWHGISGTGKYANNVSDKGTWKGGKRFANGMRTGVWEGECAD